MLSLDDDDWLDAPVLPVGPPRPLCCVIRTCKKHSCDSADREVARITSLLCDEKLSASPETADIALAGERE
jgi:hypothetical protein